MGWFKISWYVGEGTARYAQRRVRQGEIFAFHWNDAEDKRLAPYRLWLIPFDREEVIVLESSFFPGVLGALSEVGASF